MDDLNEVIIEGEAVFKYILIELTEKAKQGKAEKKRLIVRGYAWAEYHGILEGVCNSKCFAAIQAACAPSYFSGHTGSRVSQVPRAGAGV